MICPTCKVDKESTLKSAKALLKERDDLRDRVEQLEAENAALRAWIEEARDTVLYPVAHEDTSVGKLAECLGASTVELLKPNENCNAR